MESNSLVSVIICFLNEERFLEEAINSVLQQDYPYWELLLIDDGSHDKSSRIALEFSEMSNHRIVYCQHKGHINKGLSASRNLGIQKANGSLIAFLDADDVWLPGKLSNQVAIFLQHPKTAMIAEASNYWYNWNDVSGKNVIIKVGASQDVAHNPPALLYQLYPLGKGSAPCPSSLIIKKEAIERTGYFEGCFVNEFAMYEDQAFLGKMYLNEHIYISSACNNLYRQRDESIVRSVKSAGLHLKARRYYLEWFEGYLHEHNIKDARLKSLMNKALFPYRWSMLYYLSFIVPRKIWRRVKKILSFIHLPVRCM